MINLGGLVVGLRGVFFLLKTAEMYHLSVDSYLGHPFFDVLLPVNSFVFRIALPGEFSPVAVALRGRCRPEVCLSIVDAVMIYMVDEQAVIDFDDFPVHEFECELSTFRLQGLPCGVKRAVSCPPCFPFVFAQTFVIFGVHDGVPRLHQADAPEGVAVARPAIQKYKPNGQTLEPIENVDSRFDLFPRSYRLLVAGGKKAAPHNWSNLRV